MNKNVSIKKASAFYLIGTLFNKGIGFITTPIFTRMLSVSEYGTITTYTAWVSMLSVVFSLALYMGIRAAFVDYTEKVNDFCATITTFNLIYGVVISTISIFIVKIVGFDIDTRLLICCLIQAVMGAIIENFLMYLMMTYSYKLRTAFMILPNLISTIIAIVFILFVFDTEKYLARIYSFVLLYVIFGCIAIIMIYRKSKVWKKEYITYGLKISLPLVLHGIALGILSQSDRTMISNIRTEEETALYGLVYNYSMVATVLTTAFDGIWIPWFTRQMKEASYNAINTVAAKYVKGMSIVLCCIVLVGPEVIKILAPKEYWEGVVIIPALVLSNFIIFIYTLYVNIEHYYKKTVFISINTCIAALTNIGLNIFFIKWFGYKGAAYTTLISYVISLILHMLYSKKLNKNILPVRNLFVPCIYVVGCLLVFCVFVDIIWVRWLVAIALAIVTLISERHNIVKILSKDKK